MKTLRDLIEISVSFKLDVVDTGDVYKAQAALATLKSVSASLIEYYTRLLEAFDEEITNSDEVLWNFDEIVYQVNDILENKMKSMIRNFEAFSFLKISEKLKVVIPDVITVWREIVDTIDQMSSGHNSLKTSTKHLIDMVIQLNDDLEEIRTATSPIKYLSQYTYEMRLVALKELKKYEKIINKSMNEANACLVTMSTDYILREKFDRVRIEKTFANFMDFYSKKVGLKNREEFQFKEYEEAALTLLKNITKHFGVHLKQITDIVAEKFLHNFKSLTKEILSNSNVYSILYHSSDIKATFFCYAIKIPAAISAQYDPHLALLTKMFDPKTCHTTPQQTVKIFKMFDKSIFNFGKELIMGNYSTKVSGDVSPKFNLESF